MNIEEILPKIIRAALDNDKKSIEVIALNVANQLRRKKPDIAQEINDILTFRNLGGSAFRSIGLSDLPMNTKDQSKLIKIEEPIKIQAPILDANVREGLERFINEQNNIEELLKFNVKPSNTLLLYGEPGVGKTYSAKWLAFKMGKPLMILDIASVISSYLGETGTNLKKVLEYAKENNCILFLDEFDAIAKKRDDSKDIGELKRIVNVLLKELEEWPINSIVIAATNHPKMLDKAIWRRFDMKLEIPVPDKKNRKKIIEQELLSYLKIEKEFIDFIVEQTEGINAAELVRYCDSVKRTHVLQKKETYANLVSNLMNISLEKEINKRNLCRNIQKYCAEITAIEISRITGVSKSSVYRYLED